MVGTANVTHEANMKRTGSSICSLSKKIVWTLTCVFKLRKFIKLKLNLCHKMGRSFFFQRFIYILCT